jgi:hypothetical protein
MQLGSAEDEDLLAAWLIRSYPVLVGGGIAYGLALYVVNFQILGRTAFPWFTDDGPAAGLRGLDSRGVRPVLVPFLVGALPGLEPAGAARARAGSGRFGREGVQA